MVSNNGGHLKHLPVYRHLVAVEGVLNLSIVFPIVFRQFIQILGAFFIFWLKFTFVKSKKRGLAQPW